MGLIKKRTGDRLHETDYLIPLSPALPLLSPLFVSFLRSITTAEYLHQPYFETKGMSKDEIWRWVEERKWAYRGMSSLALPYRTPPHLKPVLPVLEDLHETSFGANLSISTPGIGPVTSRLRLIE